MLREKLNDTTNNYRLEWITKIENEQDQIECIHNGKDRKLEWEQLKRPGTYIRDRNLGLIINSNSQRMPQRHLSLQHIGGSTQPNLRNNSPGTIYLFPLNL